MHNIFFFFSGYEKFTFALTVFLILFQRDIVMMFSVCLDLSDSLIICSFCGREARLDGQQVA